MPGDLKQRCGMGALELTIEKLVPGGKGLARAGDGRVVFVEGALAGERVLATIKRERSQYLEARLARVLKPSPLRRTPPCAHYGRCGGCNLMHLDYSAQLKAKAQWVAEALGRVEKHPPPVTVVPSPAELGWRNRLRLHLGRAGAGFYRAGTRELVVVERCPLAAGAVGEAMEKVGGALGGVRAFEWVELVGGKGGVWAVVGVRRGLRLVAPLRRRLKVAGDALRGLRLVRTGRAEPWPPGPDKGPVFMRLGALELIALPGVFCQVNFAVGRRLVELVARVVAGGPEGQVLELFSGGGYMTLAMAAKGRVVTAVELSQEAQALAAWHVRRAGVEELVSLRQGDASEVLGQLVAEGERYAVVVMDPPRTGARQPAQMVGATGAEQVVYISCHPAAMARDLTIIAAQGYRLKAAWMLDMFPNSAHVEAVVVMER